jgi:hypothetical protein
MVQKYCIPEQVGFRYTCTPAHVGAHIPVYPHRKGADICTVIEYPHMQGTNILVYHTVRVQIYSYSHNFGCRCICKPTQVGKRYTCIPHPSRVQIYVYSRR